MTRYEHLPIYRKAFNNFHSFETAINQVTDISRQAEWWLEGVLAEVTNPSKNLE